MEVQDAVDFCREAMSTVPSVPSALQQLAGQEALRRALSTPVRPLRSLADGYQPLPPV